MLLSRRIRQSKVRVRSGTRLVALLLAVCVCSVLFDFPVLAKMSGALALFFMLTTAGESWNVWRLKKRQAREAHER